MTKIHVNSFVKRQTRNSEFSYYAGSWDGVRALVEAAFDEHQIPGYRGGVVLVTVPSCKFFSGIVTLSVNEGFVGTFKRRRPGEAPRKSVVAVGSKKTPAKRVDVVLYASSVLAEDKDNELPPDPGNWEIISINASPEKEEIPINPDVLLHNHFGSEGGTVTGLSDSEFVDMLRTSFGFWKDKVMAGPPSSTVLRQIAGARTFPKKRESLSRKTPG